jgi:hypothetical protein
MAGIVSSARACLYSTMTDHGLVVQMGAATPLAVAVRRDSDTLSKTIVQCAVSGNELNQYMLSLCGKEGKISFSKIEEVKRAKARVSVPGTPQFHLESGYNCGLYKFKDEMEVIMFIRFSSGLVYLYLYYLWVACYYFHFSPKQKPYIKTF